MATIPNGILGGIQGQVGTVTGYNRYGIDVIRVAKNSGMVKPTAKRLAQRSKITVCNTFAKAFAGKGFFTKTFPAFGHTGSGYNRAVKHAHEPGACTFARRRNHQLPAGIDIQR